jgi:hypothetical protein
MKKCAKCDFEYDDAYDGCPQCARASATPEPSGTTRCPTCGKDYDASYAHCPTCAAAAALQPKAASKKPGFVAFLVLLLLFGCALSRCNSSGSPSSSAAVDDSALTNSVVSAITAANVGAVVHDAHALSDGSVYVTMTLRKADMGGTVQAEDAGTGMANVIFAAVPGAKQVAVFDADRAIIDTYSRK